MNDISDGNDHGEDEAVSERIRKRLQASKSRFFANDNISDFILPGEHADLEAEIATKFAEVLKSLVIDVDGDHNTRDSARRIARMYINEVFAGRYWPQA